MKLTKAQTTALANKIYNELDNELNSCVNIEIEKVRQNLLKEATKFLKLVPPNICKFTITLENHEIDFQKNDIGNYEPRKYDLQRFVNIERNYNFSKIYDAIVLSTIEAEDLEGLIAKVKSQF